MRTFAEANADLDFKALPRPFTTKQEIRYPQSGDVVPAGTAVTLYITAKRMNKVYFRYGADTAKAVLMVNAHKYFSGFIRPPTERSLEKWHDMGMCRTPLGEATEPDGHDRFGMPSWLLIMGLI